MAEKSNLPLFETEFFKNRFIFRLYTLSIFISICFISYFRIHHLPKSKTAENLAWLGAFFSELWFAFYWFITIVARWNPSYRHTFKDRLSQRYGEVLPGVDIFVCTADPVIEPPTMVVSTVLSIMAYNYPPEKMSIYLSDDGGSDLTFYGLLEASRFSKKWLPFCRKYNVEPRSPEAYFRKAFEPLNDSLWSMEWSSMTNLYEDMKKRIDMVAELGRIPDDIREQHKGFVEWDTVSSRRDHQTILQVQHIYNKRSTFSSFSYIYDMFVLILQIIIDGRDPMAVDSEGQPLPTLVYLAREKRPQYSHHFKAGAMNALIRVSSRISNSPVILNVDCDMYSNNSDSVRDALCFLMDEENGDEIGFVQFPQCFDNLTKNDLYSSSLNVIMQVEIHGMDDNGGPGYIGTGCFHRRETLCGRKYRRGSKSESLRWDHHKRIQDSASVLEESCKTLASCGYEENTEWGKEMGLKYGCLVEDVLTGLAIQCRGWRSVYFNPERKGFLGLAPTTLLQSLIQHKRWSEGDLQIFLSQYCPLLYGHGKIPLKLQLSYCVWLLWAANCWASLYYVTIPSLCLLRGISLFPKVSSWWSFPFIYTIMATSAYSAGEFVWCGGTLRGWWNDQRMWVYKRTTSYFFGFLDNILRLLGITKSAFVVTAKVADDDVSKRYEQELMEFGAPSPMFTILTTIAWLNALSFIGVSLKLAMHGETLNQLAMQIILCSLLVYVNQPLYEGMFFRKDMARMPTSVTYKSAIFALVACSFACI